MSLLFNLLIFSLPLGMISRINIYPHAFIYIHDIFASLIFVWFVIDLISKKTKIHNKRIFNYLALFVVVGLISLVLNMKYLTTQSFLVSALYTVRYVIYASLIFAVASSGANFLKTLNIKLVLSGAIFIVLGFVQYFLYPDLRNLYYAGWDEHLYRLFSTTLDPNYAGAFIVLIVILVLGNALHAAGKKDKNNTLLFGALSLLSLIALYLTYSRSALVAALVGIPALLVVYKKTKFVVPVILLLFAAVFIFANTKLEGLNPWRMASVTARMHSIDEAVNIIEKNPVLGVGFNSYRYALQRYGMRGMVASNADATTDNSYLFIFATTGIVGLGIFMLFIFEIIRSLTDNISRDNVLTTVALPSLLALLVNTMFINSLFYTITMAWIFILIGATVSKKQ